MAFTVTIASVDRTAYVTKFASRRSANAVGDATITVVDRTGGVYIPAKWDVVTVADGATTIFAGYVATRSVTFAIRFRHVSTTIRVLDYNAYLDRALRNGIEVGGLTLKQHLQNLVTSNLTGYGITLAAGQATGPTLTAQLAHAWSSGRQVLDYLSLLTGYLYEVSPTKVLEAWAIGSRTATPALTQANRNILDLSWSDTLGDHLNAVWVSFGGSQTLAVQDTCDGDGATRAFVLRYYASTRPGSIIVDRVATPPSTEPCGIYGVDTMEWTFDLATSTLHQAGAFTVLAVGDVVLVDLIAQLPCDTYAENAADIAAHLPTTRHHVKAEITDADEAEAYAAAAVRRMVGAPTQIHVRTRTSAYDPGDLVSVTVTELGLSAADYFVSEVRAAYLKLASGVIGFFDVDLVAENERPRSWLDWWRERGAAAGGATGSGSSSGTGATTTTLIGVGHIWGTARSRAEASASYVPVQDYIDYVAGGDGGVTVRVDTLTDNAATSVTPRIYDVTAAAVPIGGAGTVSTSTTWAEQIIVFTAIAGHRYRLQVTGSNATHAVRAVGVS